MAQTATRAPAAQPAAGGTSWVTSKDGTRIAYERSGSGPNLVFVVGALGSKDTGWVRKHVRTFEPHFTVINYDRRGRGESTDTQPFSVQREIEDLDALVRAVGPSHVFGVSSGAALVLEAAAAGAPMRSAVAYEPPYMVGEHRKPSHTEYESRVKALVSEGRRDDALKLFMRTVGLPGLMVAVMRVLPMWKKLRPVAHTLPYDAAALSSFEPPVQRLGSIRVPTLAVFGEKTPQALRDGTRFVAKTIPGAELRSIPKQSHNLKPAAIAPLLVEFAAKHEPGAPRRDPNGAARTHVIASAATRSR